LAAKESSNFLVEITDPVAMLMALTETQLLEVTPKHAEQALQSNSAEQWYAAMSREKQCHVKKRHR